MEASPNNHDSVTAVRSTWSTRASHVEFPRYLIC
jgi:hypothetical protein